MLRNSTEIQPFTLVYVTSQVIWESLHFSVKGSAAHVEKKPPKHQYVQVNFIISRGDTVGVCSVNLQHCHKEQYQDFEKSKQTFKRLLKFDPEMSRVPHL